MSKKEENCPKCKSDDIYAENGIGRQNGKIVKCDSYECASCGEVWVWDGKNRWTQDDEK